MLINLAGRAGVVTGAGSGIGRQVALTLATAGANVAVLDMDGEAARATSVKINTTLNAAGKGGSAIALAVDVSDEAQVNDAIAEARDRLEGNLTCAVHCAGITADGFMHKMSVSQWDRVLDVNLKGTFLVTKAMAAAIKANEDLETGGSIVNLASIIGKVGNLGQANYSASKAGVVAFSKTAAKELARSNIRVNAVLPGFIDTPMAQAVPPKVLNQMISQIPLGRLGTTHEIANTCAFLCSDMATFITGAAIEVTGGQHM
ncbi:Estradiol 17-beta-dehydrogenase 8 [Hondaea fermentalgiana]|uniref:(3R)-3-hydroxyacyl-CoA dehydrogenase n=1 Tax=Hondaea fermentalgiana TaxID=2315210 RepID=A0A2R5GRE1_9STRA|nr:Estradiol 17-beta-dehydrogenase 8 [Hondaea fermentalgiana]|eukprot:GBG33447.1 Estradiol 17-beta-dehydrogenase 8 [Hondaea fermentalgiana]